VGIRPLRMRLRHSASIKQNVEVDFISRLQ
jgi:hypothetical protein